MEADTKAALIILVICVSCMGWVFVKCQQNDDKRAECERAGGIYKTFYGSSSVCFSPSVVIPLK
jgi:hypothetical protein